MAKTVLTQTPQEKAQLENYFINSVKRLHTFTVNGGVYSVVWNHQGTVVAAAGEDGHIRLIDTKARKITKDFVPVPLGAAPNAAATASTAQ